MSLRRGWILVLVVSIWRCAGPSTPPPSGAPTAPGRGAASRFASAADAEAALLELEDRRAFDAGALSSAASFPDPAVRARAALAIGRIGADRGAPIARPLLGDKTPEVRAMAAFAYQLLADPTSTPELLPLLSDADPRVRAAALYALSRKPIESSQAALTAALADADPFTAAMAARALGLLAKKDSLTPLAAVLDSGKPPLVTNALGALEAILERNPGAGVAEDRKARILALAGDANPNVAIPALIVLRQFEATDRDVRQRLWSIALTGEGRRRQIALISVVAALRDRAKEALDKAASAPDPALRAAAAESLAFLPAAGARSYRDRLAADKEPVVRLAALGSLKTADAVRDSRPLVNGALTDPDAGVRAAAVDALGQLNDRAILPLVADALTRSAADPSPDVAIAVIGVCEKLRSEPPARAIVESAYRQPKTLVSRLARRSLLQVFRGDRASLPAPEYKTGRSAADYAALVSEGRKPLQARIETSRGEFTIRLAGREAPITVANFVKLARARFFDGVPAHRVVPNFVLQDGDPTGTGNGGPGYEIRDELNPLAYERGTVGMALSGPDTGGSQWFVTHSPQPHLNALYTVFGRVASGQDVVERIEQGDRINRVTISEGQSAAGIRFASPLTPTLSRRGREKSGDLESSRTGARFPSAF